MPTQKRYEKYISEHKCPTCSKEHQGKYKYCDECLSIRRSTQYDEKFCIDCGVLIPKTYGRRPDRCPECKHIQKRTLQKIAYQNRDNETRKRHSIKSVERSKRSRTLKPEKYANQVLYNRYGITLEQLKEIYINQNGQCAICNIDLPSVIDDINNRKFLFVDHCHATNKVRGILCFTCNTGLGQFKDRIDIMEAAILYLKKHAS